MCFMVPNIECLKAQIDGNPVDLSQTPGTVKPQNVSGSFLLSSFIFTHN